MDEAPLHAHNQARDTFVTRDGVVQPNAAPRFSRTPSRIKSPAPVPGEHTESILADWGFNEQEITALAEVGVIANHSEN